VLEGDLADVAGGAVPAGVDPPGQGLASAQYVVHGAVVDDGRGAVHLGQVHDGEAVITAGLRDNRHGGVDHDGAVTRRRVLVVRESRARRSDARAGHQAP